MSCIAWGMTPTITFRGLDRSAALEADIRERAGKLAKFSRSLIDCRVLVELAERHHETGNHFHVRIELAMPGEDIVVAHDASLHAAAQGAGAETPTKADEADPGREHARVAVREAFEAARRQLQDHERRQGAMAVRRKAGRESA